MVIGGKFVQYLEPGVRRVVMGDDAADSRAAYEKVAGPVEASVTAAIKAAGRLFARGTRVTAETVLPLLQNTRAAAHASELNAIRDDDARTEKDLAGQVDNLDRWIVKWRARLGRNIGITDANSDKADTYKAITSALASINGAGGAAAQVAAAETEGLQVAADMAKKIVTAPARALVAAADAAQKAVGLKLPWWAKWAALGGAGLVVLWIARPYISAAGAFLPRRNPRRRRRARRGD